MIDLPDVFAEFFRLADLLHMLSATARVIERRLDSADAERVRTIAEEIDALASRVGTTTFASGVTVQASD